MPADRLKSIESGYALPKLNRVLVYNQFGSLPSLLRVMHVKVDSKRYAPRRRSSMRETLA